MGDIIPADIRITFAQNFRVDNSTLTGDSEPQFREPYLIDAMCNPMFASNMVFFSTNCVEGLAYGEQAPSIFVVTKLYHFFNPRHRYTNWRYKRYGSHCQSSVIRGEA